MVYLLDEEEEAVHGNGPSPSQIQSLTLYLRDTGENKEGTETLSRPCPFQSYFPMFYRYVVERFGKLHSIEDSGWFVAIPFVDKIAYIIDIRERAMDIPPPSAITRDNVSVEVSGNLFVRFNDAERAAYGAFNPLYSVTQVRIGLNYGEIERLYDPTDVP